MIERFLLGGLAFVAYATQGALGFGASLLVLTPGSLLLPLPTLIAIIVPLGLGTSLVIAVNDRRLIRWRLLLRRVLPLMLGGMALGLLLQRQGSPGWIRGSYGLFIVVLSAVELWNLSQLERADGGDAAKRQAEVPPPSPAWILAAGIVHGLFSTGGPLLVRFLSRAVPDKGEFRATLAVVWVGTTTGLIFDYSQRGLLNLATLDTTIWLTPPTLLGIWVGNRLHSRLSGPGFKRGIYGLLLALGLSLLV